MFQIAPEGLDIAGVNMTPTQVNIALAALVWPLLLALKVVLTQGGKGMLAVARRIKKGKTPTDPATLPPEAQSLLGILGVKDRSHWGYDDGFASEGQFRAHTSAEGLDKTKRNVDVDVSRGWFGTKRVKVFVAGRDELALLKGKAYKTVRAAALDLMAFLDVANRDVRLGVTRPVEVAPAPKAAATKADAAPAIPTRAVYVQKTVGDYSPDGFQFLGNLPYVVGSVGGETATELDGLRSAAKALAEKVLPTGKTSIGGKMVVFADPAVSPKNLMGASQGTVSYVVA